MKRTFTKQLLGRTAMLLLTLTASLTAMGGAEFISGSEGPKWELADGTLTISGTGAMPDFSGSNLQPWYSQHSSITSIAIGNGVTSIGKHAFSYCNKATSVSIGSGVTTIGRSSFEGCELLDNVVIPTTVQTISKDAFKACKGLTSITIPSNVTTIEEGAFLNCTGINSLTLNEGLTTIGNNAFQGAAITSVTIPQSVTTMGYNPFNSCSNLTTVTVATGNAKYTSPNGKYVIKDGNTLIIGTNNLIEIPNNVTTIEQYAFCELTNTGLTIPATVTKINNYAFAYNKMESVTIGSATGEAVTTIGEYAFTGCKQLTDVVINGTVYSIGQNAFYECTSLNSLVLNEGFKYIFMYAFERCSALASVTIPQSVATITGNPFIECSNLTTIIVTAGNANFVSPNNNCLINTDTHTLVTGLATTEIPNTVTTIGSFAFYKVPITSITIPSSVTTIGSQAFRRTNLASVNLPNSLKEIERWGFANCTNLSSVTFPSTIESIGMDAFSSCPALQEVEIPCNPLFSSSGSFDNTTTVKLNLTANDASSGKWMTFYNHAAQFQADANTTVYKAKIEDSKVKLTAIADKIVPAGTAVVLKSTDKPVMTRTTTVATGDFDGNDLKGSTSKSNTPANCYTLANSTAHGVGFYKYTGEKIGVNKAYLVPTTSSRSFFEISTDDEATTIDAATKQEANDEWYTLDGRRMKGQPTKAGVYVKKNKVVVIK